MTDDRHGTDQAQPQGSGAGRQWSVPGMVTAGIVVGLWIMAGLLYGPRVGDEGANWFVRLALLIVPLAVVVVVAVMIRALRQLQTEVAQLRLRVDNLRQGQLLQQQAGAIRPRPAAAPPPAAAPRASPPPSADPPLAVDADQAAEITATFSSTRGNAEREPVPEPSPPPRQASLALDPAEDQPTPALATDVLIRALDFPESADDEEGFRCLRLALQNPDAARLIRATQDVLTLLAQDGIYVDHLPTDRARVELWRRFAAGERGRGIADLGGIHDRSSLALTTARLRKDSIFHDAALHFLRQFDRSFQAFEKIADDAEIARLADTRTARAFMLLARVKGVFG